MKYMLLIYGNDEVWGSFPPDEMATLVADTDALTRRLTESGEFVAAYGVGDQAMAKTVTLAGGSPVVSDGPYIEAKEYLGSFTVVDCDSLERALEIAAEDPFARYGKVEVRPLMHESESNG